MRLSWRPLTLGLLCLGALALGGGLSTAQVAGAATPRGRPHPSWTASALSTCSATQVMTVCAVPRGSGPALAEVSFRLSPGEHAEALVKVLPDADITNPRLVMQSPNGQRLLAATVASGGGLANPLVAGTGDTVKIAVDVPPGSKALRASGRLYVADRGSILAPPLNVRVTIVQPTPAEILATPVIIPTNNIRIVRDHWALKQRGAYLVDSDVGSTTFDVSQEVASGVPGEPETLPIASCASGMATQPAGILTYVCDPNQFSFTDDANLVGHSATLEDDGSTVHVFNKKRPTVPLYTCERGQLSVVPFSQMSFACERGRFSLPNLVVLSGTNVAWTNTDLSASYVIQGFKCVDATATGDPPCGLPPSIETTCNNGLVAPGAMFSFPQDDGTPTFFCSGRLDPSAQTNLRLIRAVGDRQSTLKYFVRARVPTATTGTYADVLGYITVK